MKVNTQSMHFSADQKLVLFIEKKIEKLQQFFDRILGADVFLKLENSGQVRDKVAEIRLNIPGGVILCKETDKSFEAAVAGAVDSLKRQLIRHKERTKKIVPYRIDEEVSFTLAEVNSDMEIETQAKSEVASE